MAFIMACAQVWSDMEPAGQLSTDRPRVVAVVAAAAALTALREVSCSMCSGTSL